MLEYAFHAIESYSDEMVWASLFDNALENWDLSTAQRLLCNAKLAKPIPRTISMLRYSEGRLHAQTGDWPRAEKAFSQAITTLETSAENTLELQSQIWSDLGMLHRVRGQYQQALSCHQQQLTISKKIGDHSIRAEALHQLGLDMYDLNDLRHAKQYFSQALTTLNEIGDAEALAHTYNALGLIEARQQNPDDALDYHSRSLTAFRSLENHYAVAQVLGNLGTVERMRGNLQGARDHYHQALDAFDSLGVLFDKVGILNNLGAIAIAEENYFLAQNLYQESLALAIELGDQKGQRDALLNLALTSNRQDDWNASEAYYERAWVLTKGLRDRGALWDLCVRKLRLRLLRWLDSISHKLKAGTE